MVDEVRGKIRLRAWPKSRPGPRHPTNEFWTRWLKGITYVYRYQPAIVQAQLMRATHGTVWMPRDVFISSARGRAWLLQDENGRTWYPMAVQQDVSESLDAIAQEAGSMLFRGTDLWLPVPKGTPNTFLRYVSDSESPIWAASPATPYQTILLQQRPSSAITYPVNSTSYIGLSAFTHWLDFDTFQAGQFRLTLSAQANAAVQTITLQLARQGAPTIPLSAAGNDLVVPNTSAVYDSGWISFAVALSGLERLQIAAKGSNSTVDLSTFEVQIHFR